MRLTRLLLLVFLCFPSLILPAQDSSSVVLSLPEQYVKVVSQKAESIEEKLDKKSQKALAQYKAQEAKLIKKLSQLDSSAAQQLLQASTTKFQQLEDKLKNPGKLSQYIPGLDSLGTTLHFLQANNPLLSQAKEVKEKLGEAIHKVDALKLQLQKAETIKQFLKERKELLQQSLEKFGLVRELKQLNKQVYYYAQQLNEYKAILKDPKKIERKALELLSKTKMWQEFFRKNSMLASLFRLPGGDPNDPANMASLAGLQTRAEAGMELMMFASPLTKGEGILLNALKNDIIKFEAKGAIQNEILTSKAEQSLISLDNNVFIGAIEGNKRTAIQRAIGSDKPIISITAAKEFLTKGDKTALKNFMVEVGAKIAPNGASIEQIKSLKSIAASLGRSVGNKDASIVGNAINNAASILTTDKRLIKFAEAIGVETKKPF